MIEISRKQDWRNYSLRIFTITEVVNSVEQIGTGALLIVHNYTLDLIWGIDSIYLFGSRSKDKNGNLLSSFTALLLKFGISYSLENNIKSVYYNAYPLSLYFQVQFIIVHGTVNAKNVIIYLLKKGTTLSKATKRGKC